MRIAKIVGVALAFIVAVALLAPASRADESNQLTKLTFSEPVQIPGNRVLPAGTYVFKIPEDDVDFGNVVQIYNADDSQLCATVLTRPTYRAAVTDHTAITVAKAAGPRSTVALMKWFYPGKAFGQDFIYSSHRLRQFQEAGTENVIATPANLAG